ncbi:MAG: hypothetical protein J6Y07_00260 [Alphaproteobacteria bacterium]|nr:hypothetical protein [Alphaproteobacteria bacterium]
MKTKYQILIACIITCIATAFTTIYIMNHDVLGLYTAEKIMCKDNLEPDSHGCCPGETYTDMGDQGWNCCPEGTDDCFPPIVK